MPSKPPESAWRIIDPDCAGSATGSADEPSKPLACSVDDSLSDDLTDDLKAVAEQLVDDAQFLAARYPARTFNMPAFAAPASLASNSQPGTWFSFGKKAIAAVLLIAVGSVATVVAIHWQAPDSVAKNHVAGAVMPDFFNEMSPHANPADSLNFGVHEVGANMVPPARASLSEVEMLQIQTAAFEQVIRKLQDELVRRDQQQTEMRQTLDLLRQEVSDLRQRLNEPPHSDKAK
ncbi:MAG TPA: hypothetical protein VFE46_19450 [Pirellulales bacterium]|jgi:uncharacterized coiled-coil protein SlyX|nr:hypothetical protein [Pirellulales bacterium]